MKRLYPKVYITQSAALLGPEDCFTLKSLGLAEYPARTSPWHSEGRHYAMLRLSSRLSLHMHTASTAMDGLYMQCVAAFMLLQPSPPGTTWFDQITSCLT